MIITIQDVIDAIEKNGLPWTKGAYFKTDDEGTLKACALGQAAYNLDCDPNSLENILNKFDAYRNGVSYGYRITNINDTKAASYHEVVTQVKELLAPVSDRKIRIRKNTRKWKSYAND